MKSFLLIYDRHVGLMSITEFAEDDRQSAVAARRAAEVEFQGKEIVLLEAHELDDLKKTHARYFGKKALDLLANTASGGGVVISQAVDINIQTIERETEG
jgi:hypothetical protein